MHPCTRRTWIQTLALSAAAGAASPAAFAAQPLKMGYIHWADAMAVTHVAKVVLETRLNQPVQFVTTDIGIQYGSVARGDIDVMLCGWLPTSHGAYVEKHKARLDDIGVIYRGGRNGWAVPAYVPESEVASIADLARPEVKAKFNGLVQGIEPGGGLMQASERTLAAYGLTEAGYKLQPSSEAGMLASLTRAYPSKQWVVATVWSPHWLFQKWPMRYLKDPKGVLGGEEQIHAFGSKAFAGKFPRAHAFLQNFKMELADVEAVQLAGETAKSYEQAAKAFVEANPDKVKAWLAPRP
ncbi:glycine betaine ABC transporter substrate-binding protein [Pseudaquabacterium rugosum]|uniref:Glycine betaine ABC transporter substrate-binding protein n=1 Tax=Pseudaquabacterium rugosum TaxID=2984194 RepID=A0ABU9BDQ6_9BURK